MRRLQLNELAALSLVLSNISIRELLSAALVGLGEKGTTLAQDQADICSQAINTFLD